MENAIQHHDHKTVGKILDTVTAWNPILVLCCLIVLGMLIKMFAAVAYAQTPALHFGERLSQAELSLKLPASPTVIPAKVDLDKLAHAVAVAESGDCTQGQSLVTRNCHSIMTWEGGYRHEIYFPSKDASYQAFKNLWKRGYGGRFPTYEDAVVYTGGDHTQTWYHTVVTVYNSD